MPRINLESKPICITGASSGIGRATAIACAAAGMPVLVSARRENQLSDLVNHIRNAGGQAESIVADVSQDESGERIVEHCVNTFGSIYAVFANAGYGYESAHHESTHKQVRDIFETNLYGTLRLLDAAIPHLLEAHTGHMLVCSSCLSAMPTPYHSAYSATKSAQHHITSAMRFELRAHGISVSTVHPIGTTTEFRDVSAKQSTSQRNLSNSTSWFMQSPERVADTIVRALHRPKPEIWTSTIARIAFNLSALSPRTRDAVLRIAIKRRMKRNH